MNRCYNCKFYCQQDEGYSNYTVENVTISCLKNHFQPVEESYSWERNMEHPENDHEFFKQAENCGNYKYSDKSTWFDVDGEITIEDYKEDPELYEALKAREI